MASNLATGEVVRFPDRMAGSSESSAIAASTVHGRGCQQRTVGLGRTSTRQLAPTLSCVRPSPSPRRRSGAIWVLDSRWGAWGRENDGRRVAESGLQTTRLRLTKADLTHEVADSTGISETVNAVGTNCTFFPLKWTRSTLNGNGRLGNEEWVVA